LKFVEAGGDVSAIASKYDMTAAIKKDLEAVKPVKTETL
jgi:hypothetical protein